MNIQLNLEVEEVNKVLKALGDLPTKENVWTLIKKIKLQGEVQIKYAEETGALGENGSNEAESGSQ